MGPGTLSAITGSPRKAGLLQTVDEVLPVRLVGEGVHGANAVQGEIGIGQQELIPFPLGLVDEARMGIGRSQPQVGAFGGGVGLQHPVQRVDRLGGVQAVGRGGIRLAFWCPRRAERRG